MERFNPRPAALAPTDLYMSRRPSVALSMVILVGVFDVAAHGDAHGDAGDFDPARLNCSER